MVVSETHFNSNITDNEIRFENYILLEKIELDEGSNGGDY